MSDAMDNHNGGTAVCAAPNPVTGEHDIICQELDLYHLEIAGEAMLSPNPMWRGMGAFTVKCAERKSRFGETADCAIDCASIPGLSKLAYRVEIVIDAMQKRPHMKVFRYKAEGES